MAGGDISTIRGVVRALNGAEAVVEVEQGGCGRCHEKGGCGGQHLTQMLCAGKKTYRVDNRSGAQVGETVTVAVASGAVGRSANLAYGIPVLAFVGGAVLGMELGGDPAAIAGGVLGLALAWLIARDKSGAGSGNQEVRPYIVSRS